jgi:hypothetical protein
MFLLPHAFRSMTSWADNWQTKTYKNSTAEVNIGIMCACAPAIRGMLRSPDRKSVGGSSSLSFSMKSPSLLQHAEPERLRLRPYDTTSDII